MSKLKPCPFCGSEVRFYTGGVAWIFFCNGKCGMAFQLENGQYPTKLEVIEVWNNRMEDD